MMTVNRRGLGPVSTAPAGKRDDYDNELPEARRLDRRPGDGRVEFAARAFRLRAGHARLFL